MSGGYFNGQEGVLHNLSYRIEDIIKEVLKEPEGQYSEETIQKLRIIASKLDAIYEPLHQMDLLLCGDIMEDTFNKEVTFINLKGM